MYKHFFEFFTTHYFNTKKGCSIMQILLKSKTKMFLNLVMGIPSSNYNSSVNLSLILQTIGMLVCFSVLHVK